MMTRWNSTILKPQSFPSNNEWLTWIPSDFSKLSCIINSVDLNEFQSICETALDAPPELQSAWRFYSAIAYSGIGQPMKVWRWYHFVVNKLSCSGGVDIFISHRERNRQHFIILTKMCIASDIFSPSTNCRQWMHFWKHLTASTRTVCRMHWRCGSHRERRFLTRLSPSNLRSTSLWLVYEWSFLFTKSFMKMWLWNSQYYELT